MCHNSQINSNLIYIHFFFLFLFFLLFAHPFCGVVVNKLCSASWPYYSLIIHTEEQGWITDFDYKCFTIILLSLIPGAVNVALTCLWLWSDRFLP